MRFFAGGALLGAALIAGGAFLYVSGHPEVMDHIVAALAKGKFNAAQSYEDRKKVFFSIPEPSVPTSTFGEHILEKINASFNNSVSSSTPAVATSSAQSPPAPATAESASAVLQWAEVVRTVFLQLDSSHLIALKAELRALLLAEVQASPRSCCSAGSPRHAPC